MSRVIIAGSRNFDDADFLEKSLQTLIEAGYEIDEIVSGGARGADRLGELWCSSKDLPLKRFPANWDAYGKSAGFIRNKQMAEYADIAILFWDGESKGTGHMRDIMLKSGKEVVTFLIKM